MRINSAWATGGAMTFALLFVQCSSKSNNQVSATGPTDSGTIEAGPVEAGPSEAGPIVDAGGDGACAPPTSTVTNTYAPDDPNILYSGRIDDTNPKQPSFSASAVYITTKFHGSSVAVGIQDEASSAADFFDVYVDALPPVKITPAPGQTKYDATPPGLCDGDHTVVLVKRTEANIGTAQFLGFTFTGTIEAPDPKPTRKIEIIGDSITCGAGIEVMYATDPRCTQDGLLNLGNPEQGYGQGVENGYLAYGPDLARELDAEWHVTCASGIGLTRNYFNLTGGTMPQIYDLLYPGQQTTKTTTWPTSSWAPDVIVIGLGTNDFSRDANAAATSYRDPLDVSVFEAGYVQFINQLAAYYPGVTVVLVSSPILGNNYPTMTDMQLSQDQQAMRDIAAYYGPDGGSATADGGPTNVRVFPAIIDKVQGLGCGGHPDVAQQQEAGADEIVPVIKAAMNW